MQSVNCLPVGLLCVRTFVNVGMQFIKSSVCLVHQSASECNNYPSPGERCVPPPSPPTRSGRCRLTQ